MNTIFQITKRTLKKMEKEQINRDGKYNTIENVIYDAVIKIKNKKQNINMV